ncbi:hypothetical protein G9A89_003178 [Geosiphon pyriformis]|nr:hypothetical protein G9A89_003178 [Geosiphon pyriformis]
MTDFGLSGGYKVHDGLDQGEIFSPLLWRIFYDPLLCEIDTKFVVRSGRVESSSELSSFFAAGAFVDDTIWVGDCQASTHVKVASLHISGQLISIAKKSKIHRYLGIFLSTEGLSKPSVAKAHSDVCFFVNVMLKKAIMDKQFLYLVLAVLQPIISYRTQFSFVSMDVCCKWDVLVWRGLKSKAHLLHDFPVEALYHLLLYGLKSFKQVQSKCKMAAVVLFSNASGIFGHLFNHRFLDLQVLGWAHLNLLQFLVKLCVSSVNNFLAGVVKIFLDNELFLANNLPNVFHSPGLFPVSSVLGSSLYFSSVRFLRRFGVVFGDRLYNRKGRMMDWKILHHWKRLDLRGPVPLWFGVVSKFLLNENALSALPAGYDLLPGLDVLNSMEFAEIQSGLHEV